MRTLRNHLALSVLLTGFIVVLTSSSQRSQGGQHFIFPVSSSGITGQADVTELVLGKPIERELKGGEAHSYKIALAAGQYLHAVVDQKGIDVVVRLFGPDGKQIAEVDSPNGTQGPEPVSLVTDAAGEYRLEVRALDQAVAPHGSVEKGV
jgi:hypothetical protein